MDKQEFHHETMRKKLWIDAWIQVANANNTVSLSTPTTWADKALKDFDERFKFKTPPTEG